MRASRPPVPPRPSAETVVHAGRRLLDDVLLGGSGRSRAGTTVTVSGARVPARALTTIDGVLHAVLDPGWAWPSNDDELVGVVQIRDDGSSDGDATGASDGDAAAIGVCLVGWWQWDVATQSLRLDLACANVNAGPMTVALQDDDASAALLRTP
jgi:hypothetical protein